MIFFYPVFGELYVSEFAFWWLGGRGFLYGKNFGGGFVVAVVFGILHER